MLQDSKVTNSGGVAGCKIEAQYKGGVRANSMSSLIVAAGERRGSLGVGFENMIRPWGHEMRGPAGTGRGGVSMAGGREGQSAGKRNGVRGHHLPSPSCFVQNSLTYFGFLSR